MNSAIPNYPKPHVDSVARSIARPDAFAKPGTVGRSSSVRVRLTSGDKSLLPKKKKRHHDKRDVHFY